MSETSSVWHQREDHAEETKLSEGATALVLNLISGERSFDADCCVVVSMKATVRIALLVRNTP